LNRLLSLFRSCLRPLTAALLLLTVPSAARADEVLLTNGERLIGKVEALTNGSLTFKSDKVGTVTIAMADVRILTLDIPIQVVIKDETALKGLLYRVVDGRAIVEVEGARRELPLSKAQPQGKEVPPAAPRWKGTARVGLTLAQDVIDSHNLALAVKANRETSKANISLDSAYTNSRDGDVTTEDFAFLNGDYRVGQKEKRSGFINGSFQTDHVQKLDLRFLLGGGRSIQWKTGESFHLRTDLGLSFRHEDFQGAAPDQRLAAQLGYALGGRANGGLKYGHELAFYPALSDVGDNYLRAEFSLEQPLGGAFSLNARAILDKTTRPGPDTTGYTTKFIAGLGVSF
jgi:hypothetical protein